MGFSERIVTILNSTGRQVSESKGPLTSVVYDCSNGGFLSLSCVFRNVLGTGHLQNRCRFSKTLLERRSSCLKVS